MLNHFLAKKIITSLNRQQIKICTAESFTGGLLSYYLSSVNGASNSFLGGITAYSNDIKTNLLSVPEDKIKLYQPASLEVLDSMLKGSINSFNSDIAIASTGIAGPSQKNTNDPVGNVYLGIMHKNGNSHLFHYLLKGNRHMIQTKACTLIFRETLKFIISLK
ncbi:MULTISPECIES: CinA family protein [unclassified Helicobacter]|uniref:CinA family protein n=1 Tax=unclassified Helicobacter TaxID=2593540 RepID=UPI0013152C02|nr:MULTISPECIES: CinA family protein [unclassified Helicobacter]